MTDPTPNPPVILAPSQAGEAVHALTPVQSIMSRFTAEEIVLRLDELSGEQDKIERDLDENQSAMEDFRKALRAMGKGDMWP